MKCKGIQGGLGVGCGAEATDELVGWATFGEEGPKRIWLCKPCYDELHRVQSICKLSKIFRE